MGVAVGVGVGVGFLFLVAAEPGTAARIAIESAATAATRNRVPFIPRRIAFRRGTLRAVPGTPLPAALRHPACSE